MALIDLPLPVLRLCAVGFYLLCLASLFCVALAFRLPSAKTVFVCGLLTAVLTFPVTTFLPIYFGRLLSGRLPEDLIHFFLSLPVWMIGLLAALSLAAIAWMIVRLRRLQRFELTTLSLCEGLDQLPDGVSYSLPDGFPKLVNSRMQAISNEAFGVGVVDTRWLDERLQARDLQPGCSLETDANNTFLRLPDGKVWRMKQQQVETNGRQMVEMLAYDETERYNDIAELRQRNETLEKVNRELRGYLDNMNRIVREREVLAAKTRLHNEVGQCLLMLEDYLQHGGNREAVVSELTETVELLRNKQSDEHTEDRMFALFEAAKAVGVEITLRGELPKAWKELIEIAMLECLINTVKHAKGKTLEVTFAEDGGFNTVAITNGGNPPKGPIRETGGLANLRALARRQGAQMTVESAPAFRLTLRLNKAGPQPYRAP